MSGAPSAGADHWYSQHNSGHPHTKGYRRNERRPLLLVDRVRRRLAEDMRSDGIKITRAKPAFASTCLRRSMLRRGKGGAGGVSRNRSGINLEHFAARSGAAFAAPPRLCGAGGVRTLVQTTAKCAFYMRSHFIGFRSTPGKGHPSMDLCPVSYLCSGQPHRPVFQNYTPNSKRRSTGLSEEYSSAVLLFARIKRNGLRPLSCESVLCFAC